jgi:hypothetical protein
VKQGKELLALFKPPNVIVTPKLDRMFRSALNALGVLERLRQQDVSRHMIRSRRGRHWQRWAGTMPVDCHLSEWGDARRKLMNGLIYLVGLIVVILAVLSFFGLR